MTNGQFIGFSRSKSVVGGWLALTMLVSACSKSKDESPPPMAAASAAAPLATATLAPDESDNSPSDGTRSKDDRGGDKKSGPGALAKGSGGAAPPPGVAGRRPALAQAEGAVAGDANMLPARPTTPPEAPKAAASGNGYYGGGGLGGLPSVAPSDIAINPNGRFATTYRPGGGYLSAFESAVSRGVVPEGERELVSDIGARYAADVAAPTDRTIRLVNDLERGKLPPSGGNFHTRLTLRSTARAPAARPHLSVHLVLDVSGSMAGKPMEDARQAALSLVDKLAAGDDFSLVTFSTDSKVEVPDGPVGARRDQIKKTIAAITGGGGTNIGAGLTMGYAQAHTKSIPDDAVKVVMLLSDGHVNAGVTGQGELSKMALDAFQDGIQTSSFGLGGDYDGPLMSSIARDGAGGYYYLRDSDQIAPALSTELDKRLDPVATAVEVRVRLKKGVELLHVYGSRRLNESEAARVRLQEVAADNQAQKRDKIKTDRQNDQEGGMRFFLPAFARDDAHSMLLKLRVAEGVGSRPLAFVEIKYKDRVSKKNVSEEFTVQADYATSDAESFGTQNASVVRTVQGFEAGEALAEAAALVNRGDRGGAARLLQEREGILRAAAAQLGEPLFLRDAERLARLRSHTQTDTGVGDPLVLAMLLETASNVHLR